MRWDFEILMLVFIEDVQQAMRVRRRGIWEGFDAWCSVLDFESGNLRQVEYLIELVRMDDKLYVGEVIDDGICFS